MRPHSRTAAGAAITSRVIDGRPPPGRTFQGRGHCLAAADRGGFFAAGTDIITLAPDGRTTSVCVFLDRPPEGFGQHHAGNA
ncbi:hypothetical protein GCM10027570_52580 [Streptomonospora sediminis]